MKTEEAVDSIAKFFNDLIGALVPASVLAVGLAIMHFGPAALSDLTRLSDGVGAAMTIAGLLFALGHAIQAIYEHALRRLLVALRAIRSFDEAAAMKRDSYKWFLDLARAKRDGQEAANWGFHDLRSVALSVSAEAASLGRRFMFISLLCANTGTALVMIVLDYLTCMGCLPDRLHGYANPAPWFVQVAILVSVAMALFTQATAFYSRAMSTPFAIAVSELKFKKEPDASKQSS